MANSAASSLKEVTMELGGKSPLIVFDDADLDIAADMPMMANFVSSGQVCTNGTRVFVPTKCKAAFEQKVLARVERIRAGDVFDPQTNFGKRFWRALSAFARATFSIRKLTSARWSASRIAITCCAISPKAKRKARAYCAAAMY